MRVQPDDEIYRVNTVWLGPTGLTFPWAARYITYAIWLVLFLLVLVLAWLLPWFEVGKPPVWEFSIATLLTYAISEWIDHERPLGSLLQTFMSELSAPRADTKVIRSHTSAQVRRTRVRRNKRRQFRRAS